jgi:hypothetical protein
MTYQGIFGHKERQSARTHSSIAHEIITRTAHRKVINKELHELCLAEYKPVGDDSDAFTNK